MFSLEQAQSPCLPQEGGGDVHFTGMVDCFKQTVKTKGFFALWRGLTANLLRVCTLIGTYNIKHGTDRGKCHVTHMQVESWLKNSRWKIYQCVPRILSWVAKDSRDNILYLGVGLALELDKYANHSKVSVCFSTDCPLFWRHVQCFRVLQESLPVSKRLH